MERKEFRYRYAATIPVNILKGRPTATVTKSSVLGASGTEKT